MKRMQARPVIALISDFGYEDPFVGIMKGVISRISPQAQIIDINHSIPQGDIPRAAIQLWMAKSFFPSGTVFITVVDPGVGTARKAIIAKDDNYLYIGPDNGVFSYVLDEYSPAWELSNPEYQLAQGSTTFHGRDIFAPAAAHAVKGVPGEEFGGSIQNIVHLPAPQLEVGSARIHGEIIYTDQFGNLLTSLGKFIKSSEQSYKFEPWLAIRGEFNHGFEIENAQVKLLLPDGEILSWVETFADISQNECGILVGSTGLIEIAAYNQSAQDLTNLSLGDPVTLLI